jgi:hypothetical protein
VNHTEINLNGPFEKTLAAVLALPQGGDSYAQDETVALALRYLYTAAHGRTLQTSIGPISIMPGVNSSLKDAPFSLRKRTDLLALAEQRTAFQRRATQNGDSAQLHADSALSDFMAGRLGSSEWWPNDWKVKPTVIRVRRTKHVARLGRQPRGRSLTNRFRRCAPFNEWTKQHPYE